MPEQASKKNKRRKGDKKMTRPEPSSSKHLTVPMIEPTKIANKGKHKKEAEPASTIGKNVFSFDPHLLLGIPSESELVQESESEEEINDDTHALPKLRKLISMLEKMAKENRESRLRLLQLIK